MTSSEERTGDIRWDPHQQIYVGGQLPAHAEVKEIIQQNGGILRIFGYGSLCWKPGGTLADPRVTVKLGKVRGYRRCWAQKSTDHRGEPRFPGIVCTLLKDEEVSEMKGILMEESSLTEGLVYVVPPEMVDECLDELDFREKGGYARDVIVVIEDDTGESVNALLYRGIPDNPAIWRRALLDLPYAAAVMSVAVGPSGKNDEYLMKLYEFLENSSNHHLETLSQWDDTIQLASLVKNYQTTKQRLYFLQSAGSNQYNQLLLKSDNNAAGLQNGGEDAWEMTETLLCASGSDHDNSYNNNDLAKQVYAGGGNSALLTVAGHLYIFGSNERGQSGQVPFPVEHCALGFHHTLCIDKSLGHLWAMGDNSRGQVDGEMTSTEPIVTLTKVAFLKGTRVIDISCGLYHSAAITAGGELVVFGCGRFGQALSTTVPSSSSSRSTLVWNSKWMPPHGTKLLRVACGRRHTVTLGEDGSLYSFGDNKYGQLGRPISNPDSMKEQRDCAPQRILGPWVEEGFTICDIQCGWSHTLALGRRRKTTLWDGWETAVYGWGRNDRGQLGMGDNAPDIITTPHRIFSNGSLTMERIVCGSEFSLILVVVAGGGGGGENPIWGCGWNEHGNLAQGHNREVVSTWVPVPARITNPPENPIDAPIALAAGGGHIIAMRVAPKT